MSGIAVSARDLIKIYRSRRVRCRALRGITLDIAAGEFAAIVGTSGSGKSTLLNLLAGLEPPTSGNIFLGGRALHGMSEDELAGYRLRHTGFIFQNFNLFSDLTVLENTAFPLMIGGMDVHHREKRAREMLRRLQLGSHLDHLPAELSGGQQQRVAIARVLVTEPEIVFADEPTGNLDSATADEVMRLLEEEVKGRGMTLVMVTHDAERAERADKVIRIRDGLIESITAGGNREI